MHSTLLTIAAAISALSSSASGAYTVEDDYSPSNFASMFDYFTDVDPTSGYVNYISQSAAQSEGLFHANSNSVFIGVDAKNVATGRGRDSVRISSKKSYNHGLIILDLAHMPGGQCGTWPAFWLLGSGTWPQNGELDIIENVNSANVNSFAAHTTSGCSITSTGAFSGTLGNTNCDINAAGQATNAGCTIHTQNSQTYGEGFNENGGGVYATEWTSEAINIWFFSRSAIPSDVSSGSPNPSNWGIPIAQFTGGCDIDEHFKDQSIIFDITFCGQWVSLIPLRHRISANFNLGRTSLEPRLSLRTESFNVSRLRAKQPDRVPGHLLEHQFIEGLSREWCSSHIECLISLLNNCNFDYRDIYLHAADDSRNGLICHHYFFSTSYHKCRYDTSDHLLLTGNYIIVLDLLRNTIIFIYQHIHQY